MKVDRRLILQHPYALGDTVLLTGLARDIQATYPGRYELLIDCHFREVWEHNQHARLLRRADSKDAIPTTKVWISYAQGIKAAGRGQRVHMLSWYHRDFATKTGLQLQPLQPRGDLSHLTPAERRPLITGRYWLVLAGGKLDITCKWWPPAYWQQLVDRLAALGVHCVQAGANHQEHRHPRLRNVTDAVGQFNNSREFFNLVMHADGVICPVTAAMHIAACYDKPCVVLSGGREEPWWEAYTNAYGAFGPACAPVKTEHRFLHTLGLLDCCKTKGCWKHRTVALGVKDKYETLDKRCKLPVVVGEHSTPKCMEMISVDHVLEAVMSYYEGGEIPPIGTPKAIDRMVDEINARVKEERLFRQLVPPTPLGNDELDRSVPTPPVTWANMGQRRPVPVVPGLGGDDEIQITEIRRPPRSNDEFRRLYQGEFANTGKPNLIDHPLIDGKFTVFVLCYGPHTDLAKTCIHSILTTLPPWHLDLRVGLNAVAPQTLDYVNGLARNGTVSKVYNWPANIKKYPAMRKMFFDADHPIETKYVVWLDDDAKIVMPSMWSQLCETIVANHPTGSRLYGAAFVHDLQPYLKAGGDPLRWFRSASWWKDRGLKVRGRGTEATNGTSIDFAAGWFWSLAADVIKLADIPDTRLNHNGGDCCIGEQVHQLGFKTKNFNTGKSLVWCPPKENGGRRGFHEPFQWSK